MPEWQRPQLARIAQDAGNGTSISDLIDHALRVAYSIDPKKASKNLETRNETSRETLGGVS